MRYRMKLLACRYMWDCLLGDWTSKYKTGTDLYFMSVKGSQFSVLSCEDRGWDAFGFLTEEVVSVTKTKEEKKEEQTERGGQEAGQSTQVQRGVGLFALGLESVP